MCTYTNDAAGVLIAKGQRLVRPKRPLGPIPRKNSFIPIATQAAFIVAASCGKSAVIARSVAGVRYGTGKWQERKVSVCERQSNTRLAWATGARAKCRRMPATRRAPRFSPRTEEGVREEQGRRKRATYRRLGARLRRTAQPQQGTWGARPGC